MLAPPEKFNVEEHRTIIKFLFLRGKGAKQIHDEMSQTLGDSGPSYATVKRWVVNLLLRTFPLEKQELDYGPMLFHIELFCHVHFGAEKERSTYQKIAMDKNNTEPEPMDNITNNMEKARNQRKKTNGRGKENGKQTVMASGKHFIKVFQDLLMDKKADPKDRFQYMQRVYHSIFFFGHINSPQIKPEEFIPSGSWNAVKEKFRKPLEEYDTHFPSQTPYSILLEYITKIHGGNHKSLLEELEKVNKNLLSTCKDDKGTQLSAKDFALSATVIARSWVKDLYSDNTAYGASIAYKGKVPRRIMIAISSLFVWDKVISYAVSCEDKGYGIRFPGSVCCQSYNFYLASHEFKTIPPCLKCDKMFIVQFDPVYVKTNKTEEWLYGNCAETESLSNLIHSNTEIRNGVCTLNNGKDMSRETTIERFNSEHKSALEKHVKKLLVSRKFKVEQNNWALFTPADYVQC